MSVSITTYPTQSINSGQFTSYWVAAHQPIRYQVTRQDYDVLSVAKASDGKIEVSISASAAQVGVNTVGDNVYINAGDYNGTYEVLAISGNVLKLNKVYLGTATGYVNFNSAFKNYYISVVLYEVVNFTYRKIADLQVVPNSSGIADINVSEYVKANLSTDNNFGYDVDNELDSNLSGNVSLSVRENYDGFVAGRYAVGPASEFIYYVNSAQQLQDRYGSNMGEYVPFLDDGSPIAELDEEFKMAWLSDFEKPTYFEGYPFDLGFIYADNFNTGLGTEYVLQRQEETYDCNRSLLGNTETNLDTTQKRWVNRLMLDQSYSDDVDQIDVWLTIDTGVTVSNCYVEDDYVEDDYVSCDDAVDGDSIYDVFDIDEVEFPTGDTTTF